MDIIDRIINREFIIRVYPSQSGKGNNSLLSAKTFKDLLSDEELSEIIIEKAYHSGKQKYTAKLRRGLKFEFVSK